jgi:NAD+ synthase/NAD+ synthase (glutamine-hydrolysing)
VFSLNASPFVCGKWKRHLEQLGEVARKCNTPVVAVNQIGGNDDLVFDGRSVVIKDDGSVGSVLRGFCSDVQTVDVRLAGDGQTHSRSDENSSAAVEHWTNPSRELFHALVLGMRDYIRKTGHTSVLLGLSGGIDSALTAVLAASAIGPDAVHGVMMPSQFSSQGSLQDSKEIASRLGLASCRELSIGVVHEALRVALKPVIEATESGVADENVQARLRGILLMAVSNAHPRSLVLATSNKSEIATGYCTLYGDMCGALAPLGDVLKTRIYEFSRWINAHHAELGFKQPPIPENSLTKQPSAELRPNQTDQDTLPPYSVLDQIVERYIEREQSAQTIVEEAGLDETLVLRWTRAIDQMQYKRDQAAVILKVTPRAFGRGRPMPIVMKQTASMAHRSDESPRGDDACRSVPVAKLTAEC